MRDRSFIAGDEKVIAFSEIKRQRLAEGEDEALRREPWPFEELSRAQVMACAGKDVDAIATELGRSPRSVRIKLESTGYV